MKNVFSWQWYLMHTLGNRFSSLLIGQIQPNKILGLWSSIIVKMMDEHSGDLPSNFPQFYFPPPTRTPLLLYSIPPRRGASAFFLSFFFFFPTNATFCLPSRTHCVRQNVRAVFVSLPFSLVRRVLKMPLYFFSSAKSGDGRCLQQPTNEWNEQNGTYTRCRVWRARHESTSNKIVFFSS